MTRFIPDVFHDPTIRVSMFAIFAFGFAGAATSPYQSVVGIRELGLSDIVYSALIFLAAGVNVVVSVLLGNAADRMGNYRTMLLIVPVFGIIGYGAVYAFPAQATFVVAILVFLPIYGALNSLLFANVRAVTRGMPRDDIANVNSGVRAMISLSWVLVPGITGALLSRSATMLPAYLFASLASFACLMLIAVYLPRQTRATAPDVAHLSHLAALGAVVSPKIFVRVLAVALITSTLHVNATVLPLITTGAAHGAVSDIGVIVGIVALLEVIFIVFWGWVQKSMPPIAALTAGTILYVIYLLLLGFASAPWHVYALTLISGLGAAALISIPITYLQDLIADRPGLGSSLISINIFVSAGLSALLFALGTAVSSYSGTAIIGAVAGLIGIGMLLFFDGRRKR